MRPAAHSPTHNASGPNPVVLEESLRYDRLEKNFLSHAYALFLRDKKGEEEVESKHLCSNTNP